MKLAAKHEHLDTELNIVPIIDCFVMLICFLLFTAAFTQLVYLEAKLTSNTSAAAEKSRSELDQFRLVISLEDSGIRLTTTGSNAKKENSFIQNFSNEYDFKSLHEHIVQMKISNPDRYSADIDIKTKQSTNYEIILKTIDALRHLTDEEYAGLRTAEKQLKKIPLTEADTQIKVPDHILQLANSLSTNQISKDTDQKLLFPDIALLGIE